MAMQRWFLPGLLAFALCVETVPAHHSLTGVYDTSREITLEGTVTRFEFVNPHPFVTRATRGIAQYFRRVLTKIFGLAT